MASVLGGQDTPEGRAVVMKGIPMGRVATPKDVANAAAFLASEEASFITGVSGITHLHRKTKPIFNRLSCLSMVDGRCNRQCRSKYIAELQVRRLPIRPPMGLCEYMYSSILKTTFRSHNRNDHSLAWEGTQLLLHQQY